MYRSALARIALLSALLFAVLWTGSAAAQGMPAGAIFYSDFADYAGDFYVRPAAPAPDFTQLAETTQADVATSESFGHFDTLDVVSLDPLLIDDLEITLSLAELGTGGASLRISWFEDASFLTSERVFRLMPGDPVDDVLSRDLSDFSIPAAANGFELNLFVWETGGSAVFDELAVAPRVSGVIPEPSTALLLGLGLVSLSGVRRPSH